MQQGGLAAQLYTVRQFTQTPEGLADSLRRVREIGYGAVQISGIGAIAPEQVREMLAANGLVVCNTHIGYERLTGDLDAVIAEHKLWGCRHVAIGGMPSQYRCDEGGFRRFAREASEVGRKLAAADLSFSYHNHSFELVRFGRKTGLDVLYEESDPRYLQAEIDTYWVQHGGGDPAAWCARFPGRMPVVHFKDMVILNGQQTMAEVGEGNLNWPAILQACRQASVQWYAVEQDVCQRDPFESLAISYKNLREMGLS